MAKEITHRPSRAKGKEKKKKNLPMIIVPLVNLLFIFILLISIINLQMIPTKYIAIVSLILLVIDFWVLFFLMCKKLVFKIIGYIISFIVILVSSVGIYYISKTNSFLNNAFSNNQVIQQTYYIVTSSKNDYTDKNIKGNISYFNNFELSDVTEHLNNKFSLNYVESSSLSVLFNEVKNGTVNLMLIDKTSYSMVLEITEGLSSDDYDIVYEFTVENVIEASDETEDKDVFTIFLCGSDFAGYNDLNLLITVNLRTNKVLVTTIPRAYYIEIAGFDGKKNTLSFLGPYGMDTSINSIENYFNIEIDYYLKINTHSLVALVDHVGGITYCSDQAYYTTHALVLDTYDDSKGKKLYVRKGCQELDGIETLTVARERLAFYDGDRTRQKNCVKIMQAILDKMISTNTLVNYDKILISLSDLYETDISRSQISLAVKHILDTGASFEVEMQSVDGYETKDYVHFTDLKDYVIYPNESTVVDAVANINRFIEE